MKNRPLFSGCLIGFLLISLCIITGGTKFIDEFRPSVLEKVIKEKTCVRLSGHVYDIDVKDDFQNIYLKNNSIIYQNNSFKESKIIVYDEEKLNIEIGNYVEVFGEISFYERERNPGNFNQKIFYQKQGIHMSVWASEISIKEHTVNQFYQALYIFRMRWKSLIYEVLGEEEASVLSAMLLAEKSEMNEETKELYQANGIGHILAISGLHLSVIGVGLYRIFRRLSGSFVVGGAAGISFLTVYILMIGVSVSVLRALIMFLFRVGADMTGRHYDRPTALAFSAFFTILWKPMSLFDGGFWLSYGSILAIIYVLPLFEDLLFQGFWTSISINIITLPILLYCFYEVPTYSVFLNMIIVPFMTMILTCGMLGSLCNAVFIADGMFGIHGLGGILMNICGGILKLYEKICELFLELPGARLVTGKPEVLQMVFYYVVLMISVGLWWYRKRRKGFAGLLVGMMFVNMVMLIIPVNELLDCADGKINVTVLDVGQGDGIFIKGPKGNTYLIDGGSSDVKKAGKYRIESFLKSQGVGKIDYVFISHGDGDHISGIVEMIGRMNIGIAIETIVLPGEEFWDEELTGLAHLAMEKGVRVVSMKAGQMFAEGELTFNCLAPLEVTGDGNADSMVLALNYKEFNMLFTGDVEKEGEEILTDCLMEKYPSVSWEVLKVAHHGSKNSTSEEFLESILPSYALISAGRNNSYGHPHDETLERLTDAGCKILSTQENGAITIVTDGKKLNVRGYVEDAL